MVHSITKLQFFSIIVILFFDFPPNSLISKLIFNCKSPKFTFLGIGPEVTNDIIDKALTIYEDLKWIHNLVTIIEIYSYEIAHVCIWGNTSSTYGRECLTNGSHLT